MDCDFVSKYQVKIEYQENKASGVIVRFDEFPNNFFVFTAKHTFDGNNIKIDDIVVKYKKDVITIKSFIKLELDIVIFIFDNNVLPIINDLEKVDIGYINSKSKKCAFSGYPSNVDGSYCEEAEYNQQLDEIAENLYRIKPIKGTDSFKHGGLKNSKGYSGSGLFNENNEIVGIIKEHEKDKSAFHYIALAPLKNTIIQKINLSDNIKVTSMINLEIAIKETDTLIKKGELVERLVSKILQSEGYILKEQLSNNGMKQELIYKKEDNNIYINFYDIEEVKKEFVESIVTKQLINDYDKVWILTTNGLENSADKLVSKLETKQNIIGFSKNKLLNLLISTKVIVDNSLLNRNFLGKDYIENNSFIIFSEYGYFYIIKIQNDKEDGIIVYDATNGDLIRDTAILNNLSNLNTSYKHLDFYFIESLFEDTLIEKEYQLLDANKLNLSSKFKDKIKKNVIKFNHPYKENISLADLFIYPDLEIISKEIKDIKKSLEINSETFINVDEVGHSIIYGSATSGKTSLAYMLQLEYLQNKYIPIIIEGKDINNKGFKKEKIKRKILKSFNKQYDGKLKISALKQLELEKIILIIDDFHYIFKNDDYKVLFIDNLMSLGYKYVLFIADESLLLKSTTEGKLSKALFDFHHFRLLPLGHKLRNQIIKKWIALGRESEIDKDDLLYIAREKEKTISSTVGYNLVPSYPLYILTLLQSMEANSRNLNENSSYGHYYSFLIVQYLNSDNRMKEKDITTIYGFLSALAYKFLKEQQYTCTKSELLDFYLGYRKEKKFTPSFNVMQKVIDTNILIKNNNDGYKFSHEYLYYYFVAKHLANNINNHEIVDLIQKMSDRMYRVEFANIIMFLLHHSPQDFILEMLINKTKQIFKEVKEFTFSIKELENINTSLKQERLQLEDKTIEEARDEELEREEQHYHVTKQINSEQENEYPDYDEEIEELDTFSELNLAFKMIEILGQIVKSNSNLDGNLKYELIEEAYKVSLRAQGKLVNFIEINHSLLLEEIKKIIESKSYISEYKKNEIAGEIVFAMVSSISKGIISKIAKAVSSEELKIIYKEIRDSDSNNLAIELINQAIILDFKSGLKVIEVEKMHKKLINDNNTLPDFILKKLVLEHLYMFKTDISIKQSISRRLGLNDSSLKREQIKAVER